MEMAGEFLDDPDVGFYGTLSVITSLEFLQHHSAKMGHKDTSCDPQFISMSGNYRSIYLTRSVRRASGLVQTPYWLEDRGQDHAFRRGSGGRFQWRSVCELYSYRALNGRFEALPQQT